ncbi:MAG: wax ester/triacylglycerol synthase family O-acyltransferase [Xanthomonadales bacterium]|jgi:WS/DGAT/MGAT family acyltransferase|nr:wax ester/triacylglycerol synthase family O-acyltransferase [Xanthomonadales bacterium]
MSKVDTAWLRMEQPSNLMMITGIIGLEEDIDYERLLETIEQRFLVFDRFRQKAVDGAGGAHWEMDEDFDLRSHVRRVALPGKADEEELRILVAHLASSPLNHARPLWQFHLVENFEKGPVLICRIHHCIADGIALVQVFLSLTDDSPAPQPAPPDPESFRERIAEESPIFQRLLEPAKDGIDMAIHLGQKAIEEGVSLLQDPSKAQRYAHEVGEMAGELAHALALPNDPKTRFKGRLGPRKEVAWAKPLPLDEVKSVGKAFGCTVNDVLIACASGALRRYLLECGSDGDTDQDIRATVPVNLRPLEHALELGNHFGLVFLDLPISIDNPLERLYVVNDRMTELKRSRQAAVTFGVLAALGMGPSALQKPILDVLSEKASAVLTNVPGPQKPLYLAGSMMRSLMFWVPQNGNIGIGISILSYNGKVFFGLITDRRRIPDPQSIIDRFRPEFDKLLYLGMMLPLKGRPCASFAENLLEK